MRFRKVSVKGLFGYLDHEIPLNQESRITIIYGPNGVGKTFLLELIHGLFHYEYRRIWEAPFENLRVEFEGGEFIHVEKHTEGGGNNANTLFLVAYEDGTGQEHIPFLPKPDDGRRLTESVKERRSDLRHVYLPHERQQQYWVSDDNKFSVFTREDILQMYPSIHDELYGEMPDWFKEIRNEAKSELISTARLKRETMRFEWAVAQIMMEQAEQSDLILDYVIPAPENTLTSLSFPTYKLKELDFAMEDLQELIEQADYLTAKVDDISTKIDDLTAELAELNISRFGVHSDWEAELLQLQALRDFALAASLFLNIINSRLLFKHVNFDREESLKVVAQDGSEVPLSVLSSGEQHLLVLYYQLLFEVQPDTLVMIDEPELSMNVVWQRRFLDDLERIVELRNFDVLIATHSPQIISDKWDWMVPLGESESDDDGESE